MVTTGREVYLWNYMYVLYKANTGPTFLTTRVLVPKQCTLCCVRRYDVVSQGWFSAASQDNLISLGTKLRVGKRGRCDLRLQVERRERLWLQLRDGVRRAYDWIHKSPSSCV